MRRLLAVIVIGLCAAGSAFADFFDGPGAPKTSQTRLPPGVTANVLNTQISNYTIAPSDCGKTIQAGTGSTGQFTITLPGIGGFPPTCAVYIKNSDTGRGKVLTGFPSDFTDDLILWPLQTVGVEIVNGAWASFHKPDLWRLHATTTWYVDPVSGNDSNDCLATGTGACLTIAGGLHYVCNHIDAMGNQPIIQLADDTTHYTTGVNLCDVKGAVAGSFTTFAPTLRGNVSSLGNVVLKTTSSTGITAVNVHTGWRVEGFEFQTISSGNSIVSDVQSVIYIGANKFTTGSCCNVMQALNGGFIEWVANFTINGTANTVMYANNGGRFISQPITVTISGTPAWGFSFAFMASNASAYIPSVTFSGSATGTRCSIATAAGIDTNGSGSTYLPGSVACSGGSIVSPGWYN